MEMGTMDNTLLPDHGAWIERLLRAVERLSRTGAGSTSETMLCLIRRSGDEVSDDGHMVVSPIGQAITSSTSSATPAAAE